ncbi:MAG: saccharopine dehydrogenase NADP-binding domain-containing protein [Candidatus Bathyarchaeota archaeon]|nr:saccharopine dehydrogenase NADP-binding domain-containing protein [Candidatus Bathyarchaeota archaeon]
MRILTIGCGHIGSVIARELAEALPSAEIMISDSQRERAEEIASNIGLDNVRFIELDVSDQRTVVKALTDFDLAVGLTPGRAGYGAVNAAIQAGVDIVDLSYMSEDPFTLNEAALDAGVCVVPDCGVAPGLSNLLVGRAVSQLDEVHEVSVLVGGLPETPTPPMNYTVTWCVEDLIEEYVRDALIVKDGKPVTVKALDGLEEVEFPGVGRLEAFYTDGVRTLHHTVKGVRNMWEKTMRYPGHVEKIKVLRSLGFFSGTPVTVGDDHVVPRDLTTVLLEQRLGVPGIKDVVAMSVAVEGSANGVPTRYLYRLLDRYDELQGITAMARTTAYTASIIIQLLVQGAVKERGVVPPEALGMNRAVFYAVMTELEKKGIQILHEREKLT